MRDPKRIDRMLALLRTYWAANPDLRLGQLVENFSIFYMEDDKFEEILREAIKNLPPRHEVM